MSILKSLAVLPASFAVLVGLAGCSGSSSTRGDGIARGWIDRSTLLGGSYPDFDASFDTTHVETELAALIGAARGDVNVLVVLGTWCPDSRREVPKFLKIADRAGIPPDRIRLYAVDRSKTSPDGVTAQYRIERVPTFIFQRGGKEVGRIVEQPRGTMEAEMLAILTGQAQ